MATTLLSRVRIFTLQNHLRDFQARLPNPHTHPDNRTYTVISGTWYVGFGTEFDESKLIALTAGSFYTEPAGVPHFIAIKDEGTIVQIGGTGPTRQIPAGSTKKKEQ
jgi:quercetin dioxygenase-like cupin family protein